MYPVRRHLCEVPAAGQPLETEATCAIAFTVQMVSDGQGVADRVGSDCRFDDVLRAGRGLHGVVPLTISWTRLLTYSTRPSGRRGRRSSFLRQRCASFVKGPCTRSPRVSTIDLVMRPPVSRANRAEPAPVHGTHAVRRATAHYRDAASRGGHREALPPSGTYAPIRAVL